MIRSAPRNMHNELRIERRYRTMPRGVDRLRLSVAVDKHSERVENYDRARRLEFRKFTPESPHAVRIAVDGIENAPTAAFPTDFVKHQVCVELLLGERNREVRQCKPAAEVISPSLADQLIECLPRHGFGVDDPIRAEDRRIDIAERGLQFVERGIPRLHRIERRHELHDRALMHVRRREKQSARTSRSTRKLLQKFLFEPRC